MATLSIVEHLNVLKQIGSGFLPVAIAHPDDPFALERMLNACSTFSQRSRITSDSRAKKPTLRIV